MLPFLRDSLSFPNFIGCTIQESLAKTLLDRRQAGRGPRFFSILEFAPGETLALAMAKLRNPARRFRDWMCRNLRYSKGILPLSAVLLPNG